MVIDPITAIQDCIDTLALSLFEALRLVRGAVIAPDESRGVPGTHAGAFLPAGDVELDPKESTAKERLLHGVNPAYFPPRAFDLLEPDYEAFIMAYVSHDLYAKTLVERFAAESITNTDEVKLLGVPSTSETSTQEFATPPAPVQIGDAGYEFRKQFDAGWFTGKVTEIRPLAASGHDRRCVFSDGDIEDLTVEDLERLAKLDPEYKNPPAKTPMPLPGDKPPDNHKGVTYLNFPLTQAHYSKLLLDSERERDVQTTALLAQDVVAKSRAVDDLVAKFPGMGRTRQEQLARIHELIDRNHAVTRKLEEAYAAAQAQRKEVRTQLGESTCLALGVEEESKLTMSALVCTHS